MLLGGGIGGVVAGNETGKVWLLFRGIRERKARNKHPLIIFVPPHGVRIRLASSQVGFLGKGIGAEICLQDVYWGELLGTGPVGARDGRIVEQSEKEHEADIIEASHSPTEELINWDGMALQGFLNQDKAERPLYPLFDSHWMWAVPGGGMTLGKAALYNGGLGHQLWADSSPGPVQLRERTPQPRKGHLGGAQQQLLQACMRSYFFIPDRSNYLSPCCALRSSLFTLWTLRHLGS